MADSVAVFAPGQRLEDALGVTMPGGYVKFYEANSAQPKQVFADVNLTISLGATVYTDAGGYPVTAQNGTQKTQVYTGTDSYKIEAFHQDGTPAWSHSECKGAVISGAGSGSSGLTQTSADVRYTRYANALAAAATVEDGDKFTGFDASAASNSGFDWAVFKSSLLSQWQTSGALIPSGTRIAFQQATPPVGWVKETGAAYNDATLKFTTGATVSTGGTQAFSTVFVSQTPSGSIGGSSLTEAQTAIHDHFTISATGSSGATLAGGYAARSGAYGTGNDYATANAAAVPTLAPTDTAGSGQSHLHALTMNAMNFETKFVEFSIGQKS